MSKIEDRLSELGIALPAPAAPVANYVPFVRSGAMLHISGQVSVDAGGGIKGVVGQDVEMELAKAAARLCGVNLIAALGELDTVARIVKLGGFVQAGPSFFEIPQVVNGCSDLMVEVFGERGKHARSAVGVYRLPMNFAVEVDAIIEIA
jgi:enamine deaminase RidA (YjgF/YER057c/UK114 family)